MSTRQLKIIDGTVYYQCTACFRWLRETCFYRTSNPDSRCDRRGDCKRCFRKRQVQSPVSFSLSKKQIVVAVELRNRGDSIREIAARFCVSDETIRRHLKVREVAA